MMGITVVERFMTFSLKDLAEQKVLEIKVHLIPL